MFIVHTKLYSDNAYPVIAASNIAKDKKQLIYSLDKDTVKTVERTRNGVYEYHNVLRLPDGEVAVFGLRRLSYSLQKVHGEIIDFIAQLQNVVDEDERFFILPPGCAIENLPLKKALSNACLAVSNFIAWNFIYEKDDVDYILNRPLTLRETRNIARQLGKQNVCLDPLLVEQRRLVLSAVVSLYRRLEERYDSKSRKSALVEIANRYTVSLPFKYRAVPVVYQLSDALARALDFGLREDIHRFIDDGYREGCVFGMENPSYERIAAIKAELDEDLFDSEEYKDFLSALKIDTADFPGFPSPALIACQWSDYDHAMKLSI